jgi:hypothetical protein
VPKQSDHTPLFPPSLVDPSRKPRILLQMPGAEWYKRLQTNSMAKAPRAVPAETGSCDLRVFFVTLNFVRASALGLALRRELTS